MKYGRLSVISKYYVGKRKYWSIKCECGTIKSTRADGVKSGRVKSCGCLNIEIRKKFVADLTKHNESGTLTYHSWNSMRGRCLSPTDPNKIKSYKNKGIVICEKWMEFSEFLKDMGERPSNLHTIDRIDNDGNYEPGNCRWATKNEQANNRNNNVRIMFKGQLKTISEVALICGIPSNKLWMRLYKCGWSLDKAIIKTIGG